MEEEIDAGALRIANLHTSPLQANMLGLEIMQYNDRKLDKVYRYFYSAVNKKKSESDDHYKEWKKQMIGKIG